MRLGNPFEDFVLGELFETVLPDFVLAFAFFTSICYAILGKRFGQQRPAIAMSAAIGFALSVGLVWWEKANGFSIKNLGPIAIGFAIVVLTLVIYHSIHQVGGSWAGVGIALGVSILIARILKLRLPFEQDILQTIMLVGLVVGIIAFLLHHRSPYQNLRNMLPKIPDIRHDMSDLYKDRRISKGLAKGLRRVRHEAKELNEHPEEAADIIRQLKRILPAEGLLTQRMAQLRAKAYSIRNGHIARLDETRNTFANLPVSIVKHAAAGLTAGYNRMVGIDLRLERLDKAVAEYETRIRDLTYQAQQHAAQYNYPKIYDCLKEAEKLQRHNSRLLKIIGRSENKLSAVSKAVVRETKEVVRV
jgi:hypothetical protein